jgi:hypothetical protein
MGWHWSPQAGRGQPGVVPWDNIRWNTTGRGATSTRRLSDGRYGCRGVIDDAFGTPSHTCKPKYGLTVPTNRPYGVTEKVRYP